MQAQGKLWQAHNSSKTGPYAPNTIYLSARVHDKKMYPIKTVYTNQKMIQSKM